MNKIKVKEIIENLRLTSDYGYRYLNGIKEFHHGIDFGKEYGYPIKSFTDGTVTSTLYEAQAGSGYGGYGNVVIIKCKNGFTHVYAHMTKNKIVSVNQHIKTGEAIGYMGDSGQSFGAHLHYEIRPYGKWRQTINPLSHLGNLIIQEGGETLTSEQVNRLQKLSKDNINVGKINLDIDNKVKLQAISIGGESFVKLKVLAELLEAETSWNAETKTAHLKTKGGA